MTPDDYKLINYTLYTAITAGVTIGVGRSLHRAGAVFLRECFHGDRELSASVNHLLLVGFYLVNFGALALLLKLETPPADTPALLEALTRKLGWALAGLGAMHFFNLHNFNNLRRRAQDRASPATATTPAATRAAADFAAIDRALTPPPLPTPRDTTGTEGGAA